MALAGQCARDGDECLTEMASAMQSSASRLMTRCEMSPPLARPGMGLSVRPLRCCLFIESPTLPFLLLSSYSRHGISCWRTRNTDVKLSNVTTNRTGLRVYLFRFPHSTRARHRVSSKRTYFKSPSRSHDAQGPGRVAPDRHRSPHSISRALRTTRLLHTRTPCGAAR